MSVSNQNQSVPVLDPVHPGSSPSPASAGVVLFAPSSELGEQLRHIQQVQAEIDRRSIQELARLRVIQDRDQTIPRSGPRMRSTPP